MICMAITWIIYPMLGNSASGHEIGLPGLSSAGFYSGGQNFSMHDGGLRWIQRSVLNRKTHKAETTPRIWSRQAPESVLISKGCPHPLRVVDADITCVRVSQRARSSNPAALGARIEIKNGFPPDPPRNRPKTTDLPRKMTIRSLLRTPGGGESRTK